MIGGKLRGAREKGKREREILRDGVREDGSEGGKDTREKGRKGGTEAVREEGEEGGPASQ